MSSKLSYPELRKIVWMIADKIRDKGRGNSNDYMPITVGLLFLKRLMDMRAEYKRGYFMEGSRQNSVLSMNDGNIDDAILNDQVNSPAFAVSEELLRTYRIEWRDVATFPPNDTGDEIEISYADGMGGAALRTDAANKFILLRECLEAFSHAKIHEIFATFNFLPKVYNPNSRDNILDPSDFEAILEDLNAYDFGLASADEDIFADVYMDLLGRFAAEGGKKGGEFFTPTKVVRGAIKFLDIEVKARKIVVADLAAGACTFMVEFANAYRDAIRVCHDDAGDINDRIEFVTGEKERTSYALGNANMLLHGYSDNHTAFNANSITEYDSLIGRHCRQKVDYLLANPPYGLKDYGQEFALGQKNMPRWAYGVPNKGDGEFSFLLTIIDMLSEEGKAVVVMPLGTLFRDSTAAIRQRLIEKDLIEGIVQLPKSMFLTTSIPVCLWIVNKRKKIADQGRLFVINAEEDFVKAGKLNEWNDTRSTKAFMARSEIGGYSRYVEAREVAANDFSLSVSRYVEKKRVEKEVDIAKLTADSIDMLNDIGVRLKAINRIIRSAMPAEIPEAAE
jgi:type I restriction-modification system DNA methylase subunit